MSRYQKGWSATEKVGAIIAVLVILFAGFGIFSAFHTKTMTCSVTDKDRTRTENGSDARVYTDDCGTLQVQDSLFSWTFSSADTYASIEPGKTYDVKTRGLRVPFLSMFPNVVEADPVSSDRP